MTRNKRSKRSNCLTASLRSSRLETDHSEVRRVNHQRVLQDQYDIIAPSDRRKPKQIPTHLFTERLEKSAGVREPDSNARLNRAEARAIR